MTELLCDTRLDTANPSRYQAITVSNLRRFPEWSRLTPNRRETMQVVAHVFPFRTNTYVTRTLIDWSKVPDDPIFRLTFPYPDESGPAYGKVRRIIERGLDNASLGAAIRKIRLQLNPHPAGQLSDNVPMWQGRRLEGFNTSTGRGYSIPLARSDLSCLLCLLLLLAAVR